MAGLRGNLGVVVGPWGVEVQPPVTPLSSLSSYQENDTQCRKVRLPLEQDVLVIWRWLACVVGLLGVPASASRRRREMCGWCRSGDGSRSGVKTRRRCQQRAAPPRRECPGQAD